MLYIGVALSYYGFRMFLTRPYLHYYEGGVSGPSSSRIHEIASLCVDYACHIIDLVPEPPSVLDLAALPCWWCIVPNVYAVAKIVVNEASHKFAKPSLIAWRLEQATHLGFTMAEILEWYPRRRRGARNRTHSQVVRFSDPYRCCRCPGIYRHRACRAAGQ
jgi:hypothetical protein